MPCSHIVRSIAKDAVWTRVFIQKLRKISLDFPPTRDAGGNLTWEEYCKDTAPVSGAHGIMTGLIVQCAFDSHHLVLVFISAESRFQWLSAPTLGFVWSHSYHATTDTWDVVLVCNLSAGTPLWGVARLRVRRVEWFCQQFSSFRPYEMPENAPHALQAGTTEDRLRAFLTWCEFQLSYTDGSDSSSSCSSCTSTVPGDYFDLGFVPYELNYV